MKEGKESCREREKERKLGVERDKNQRRSRKIEKRENCKRIGGFV